MVVSGGITAYSLHKINQEEDPRAAVPKAAMMTAAFFIASSIFFPMPPPMTSAHLILAGTMGVMLGWYAFPAIVIGLILQAIVFGHGGITVLGANALIMGVPALVMHALFQAVKARIHVGRTAFSIGFVAGSFGIVLAALIFYGFIIGTLPADIDRQVEIRATLILCLSHIPVAIVEGLFTGFLLNYLRRTRPDMIGVDPDPSPMLNGGENRVSRPATYRSRPATGGRNRARRHRHQHTHSHGHTGRDIDAYAGLKSPVHRWVTPLKMVGLLALIIAFASIQDWRSLPAVLILTVIIYSLTRIPWSVLRQRLTVPGYVIAAIVIFLPFISGSTVLAAWGPLTVRAEGLALAALIAGRLAAIVTLAFVMFGTDAFIRSISALRTLRFPDIMADMVLLTYRYLYEIGGMFSQMQTSARLRGFEGGLFSLGNVGTLAALVGHLFIRSYEKSERVYRAMVLRGYGVGGVRRDQFVFATADYWKTAVCVVAAIVLIIIDRFIFN